MFQEIKEKFETMWKEYEHKNDQEDLKKNQT